jgi:putative flippase GtrA
MRLLVQLSRFSVVGVINTVVDLAVLNAETLLTGIKDGGGYAVQKAVSFSVAAVVSYLLNKRWTFLDLSTDRQGRRFAQFLTVSVVGALINVAGATAAVTYGKPWMPLTDQVWVNVGALCGTAAGFVSNFLGYKFLVFRGAR